MRWNTFILLFIWTQSAAFAGLKSDDFRFKSSTEPNTDNTELILQDSNVSPHPHLTPPQHTLTSPNNSSSPHTFGSPEPTPFIITPQMIALDKKLILNNFKSTVEWISEENLKSHGEYVLVPISTALAHLYSDLPRSSKNDTYLLDKWFIKSKLGIYPLLRSKDFLQSDNAEKLDKSNIYKYLNKYLPEVLANDEFLNESLVLNVKKILGYKNSKTSYIGDKYFHYFRDLFSWVINIDSSKTKIYQEPLFVQRKILAHHNFLNQTEDLSHKLFYKTPTESNHFSAMPISRHPLEMQTSLAYLISNRKNKTETLQYQSGRTSDHAHAFTKKLMQLWPNIDIRQENNQHYVDFNYIHLPNRPTADNIPLSVMWMSLQNLLEPASLSKETPWEIFDVKKKESILNMIGIGELINIETDPYFSIKGLSELNDLYKNINVKYETDLGNLDRELLKTSLDNKYTQMDSNNLLDEFSQIFSGSISSLTLIPQIDTHQEEIDHTLSWFQLQNTQFSTQVSRTRGNYETGSDDMIQGLLLPAPLGPLLERFHRVRLPKAFPKGMKDIKPGFQAQYLFGLVNGTKYHSIDSRFPMNEVLYINKDGIAITGATLTSAAFSYNLLLFYKLHTLCRESGKFKRFSKGLATRAFEFQRDFRQTKARPSSEPSEEEDITEGLIQSLTTVMKSLSSPSDIQQVNDYCYRIPFLPLRSHAFQYFENPDYENASPQKGPKKNNDDEDDTSEKGYDGSTDGFTKPSDNPSNTLGRLNSVGRQVDEFLTNYLDGIIIATVLITLIVLAQKEIKKKK
jgi:hypothetical protein